MINIKIQYPSAVNVFAVNDNASEVTSLVQSNFLMDRARQALRLPPCDLTKQCMFSGQQNPFRCLAHKECEQCRPGLEPFIK